MLHLFVAAHDEASYAEASQMVANLSGPSVCFEAVRLRDEEGEAGSGSGKLVENRIFEHIGRPEVARRWATAQYVGVVTHSMARKTGRRLADPGQYAQFDRMRSDAAAAGADVVGLRMVDFYKYQRRHSMLEAAVGNHGVHFYRAWHGLLSQLGYADAQIVEPAITGFFHNWWFCRPALMRDYIAFYRRAAEIVLREIHTTHPSLAADFDADAFYRSHQSPERLRQVFGHDYMTMHPFVFERLPPFYFFHRPDVVVRAKLPILRGFS